MLTNEGRAALGASMGLTGDPDEVYDTPGVGLVRNTLVSFWVRQVRELYLSTVDMEVDEFEALIAVALTGHRPDDDRVCAYAPLMEMPNPWYADLDKGIGTKGEWM